MAWVTFQWNGFDAFFLFSFWMEQCMEPKSKQLHIGIKTNANLMWATSDERERENWREREKIIDSMMGN